MKAVILVAIMVAIALPVLAGEPVNGTYKSSLGQFDEGRESSWWSFDGFVSNLNTMHAESWNGSTLGGDWKLMCPFVVNVNLIDDTVNGAGNGHRIYMLTYIGGFLELSGTGPWTNGDAVYTAWIVQQTEIRTIQYIGNAMVGSVSDHQILAKFPPAGTLCAAVGIGNGVWLGSGAAAPAGYPTYRDPNCLLRDVAGSWGDVRDITISIHGCVVGTEEVTWGTVKAMYKD
jgi:hypothetical protein